VAHGEQAHGEQAHGEQAHGEQAHGEQAHGEQGRGVLREPPASWFWSHDIKPGQVDSVVTPGTRLVRLSSYGVGAGRRFAALAYLQAGPDRGYVLDRGYALDLDTAALDTAGLDASAGLASRPGGPGSRPVAITASEDGLFSVVYEAGPGPPASVHVGLDEDGLRGLSDDHHHIADLATYLAGGRRTFAAIVQPRTDPSWLFVGLAERDLNARLRELGLAVVRLRAYRDAGQLRLAAIAEPATERGRTWYADLDGDAVARELERHAAYPTDLDATRDNRGVRFTVAMRRTP
jgi:hypothetical protein